MKNTNNESVKPLPLKKNECLHSVFLCDVTNTSRQKQEKRGQSGRGVMFHLINSPNVQKPCSLSPLDALGLKVAMFGRVQKHKWSPLKGENYIGRNIIGFIKMI